MTQASPAVVKIPTDSPQPARGTALRRPLGQVHSRGGRPATRGGGQVIELEHGITMYPARSVGGRWRAVWHEAGRREQCEAPPEEKLAAKLEKVKIRLEADGPNMRRPGADLIAWYLNRTATRSAPGGPASTRTPSGGCASGSPSRSSGP
jgi:hypothetical protein